MKSAYQIQQEIDEKNTTIEAILACCKEEDREPTEDEQADIDAFYGEDGKGGELENLEARLKSAHNIENRQKQIAASKLGGQLRQRQNAIARTDLVPAECKRRLPLKAFSNDEQGEKEAFISGQWLLARIFNHQPAQRWIKEHGYDRLMNQQAGGTVGQGKELVPEPLEAAILKRYIQLSVGVNKARNTTMTSMTHRIPNQLTGLTVYYPDENAAITPSHETFDQITLTARKLATLTQVSSELTEDSVVSIMDELAEDAAYRLALKTDDDMFNGDGTATYGSVTGLANGLNANSVITGAGPASSAFTLANYEACVALNPFFMGAVPEWYMSSAVWANSALPLLHAAGGTPGSEISDGYAMRFMGFPVNIVQVMDNGSTVSTNQVYFGTFSQSVFYGRRRGITIATSEHYGFNTDSIYLRSTMRNAITVNNHDGSTAGPITAIATAAA